MAYAEAMSQTPPTVTDEMSARLLKQLGAAASVRYDSENEYKLYVLDISDPANPAEIGRFELPGNVTKMVAAGDTMYMRLSDSGVWALNINDRSHPYLSGHLRSPILDFGVDGDLLYLATGDAGLVIVQVEK